MTRFKSVGVNIGVIFLAIFILGIILEVGLAVVQINQKSHVRLVPGKGVTYIPGVYYRHTKEGFAQGYFNSHGFRDYERTYEKPKDTFRILIFGDQSQRGGPRGVSPWVKALPAGSEGLLAT